MATLHERVVLGDFQLEILFENQSSYLLRYGDRVDEWGTLNEPVNYLLAAYGLGAFPPGKSTLFQLLDRFIPVTFGAAPVATAQASLAAGKVSVTVANAKGNKVTFVVAGKKYVRNVTADSYVFSVPAPKGKFVVTAGLDRKQLTKVSLTN